MTINIRPSNANDNPVIIRLLKELDLYYKTLEIKDFWVAAENGQIVAAAQLLDCGEFLFLSSVGVAPGQQNQGIARQLLNKLLANNKPVYLYTIIPDFFKKFGFETTTSLPQNIPTKDRYECADCYPDRCVTMVKHAKTA